MKKIAKNTKKEITSKSNNSVLISNKAITLIALIITIIVLIILAGVSISLLFGNNGMINKSKEAKFKTNFSEIQEKVELYMTNKEIEFISQGVTKTRIDKLPLKNMLSSSEKEEFKEHLKQEIISITGKDDIESMELYYIDKEKINSNQKHTYIIDVNSMQIYDVEGENFSNKWHHTLNSIGYEESETVEEDIINNTTKITMEGQIGWYSPNVDGFNGTYTYMIYYNKADTTDIKEIPVKEYIENGKKNKIEENGKTYVLDLYNEKMWANAKTTANGLECWWVWIPRYAYKADSTNQNIKIVFIDKQNNPIGENNGAGYLTNDPKFNINTFSQDYIIHPGFTIKEDENTKKELEGMWIAKYEASNDTTHQMSSDKCYEPDLSGFDRKYTYIELYDETSNTYYDEQLLDTANLTTINNENKWYDYSKRIWANVKTTANGLECWWVWIPRYAYNVSEGSQEIEIIFIDTNNTPIDKVTYGNTLSSEFTVHPGFDVEGEKLKGIWVAKYEASNNITHEMSSDEAYAPDLSGFDKQYTYIEYYDKEAGNFDSTKEVCLADVDETTLNKDNKWYDYSKRIWANIKTNANGLECWWVWIPRYAYNVLEGSQEIEVIFIDTNNTPMDKERYGNTLNSEFTVHPGFDVEGERLKGIWVAKYEVSNVSDTIKGTTATGANSLPQVSDQAGNNHTHVGNGAGTTERYVTSSKKWCSAYDGTPCSNYGYYIYCSECGVRLRHYWCKAHYNKDTKVIIDDSNVE